MNIKIVNKSDLLLPSYATLLSAGMDLRADLVENITLLPMARVLIHTGLHISLPEGYWGQVCPRSGLAIKKGVTVLNAPGVLDADYTGNIGVILINLSSESVIIEPGERIAQLIISKHERADWVPVNILDKTERGEGGFGHTGVK